VYANDLYSFLIDKSGNVHELGFVKQGQYSLLSDIDQALQVATSRDKTLLVLKDGGSVWALGAGQEGQLGTGQLINADRFLKVPVDGVIQIGFTRNLALAVRKDHTLWAWGQDAEVTGSQPIWLTPHQVMEVPNVQSITWGDGVSILDSDGTVTVWVDGEFHAIDGLPSITQIDGGYPSFTLGVAKDGTLWAWGTAWPLAVRPDPTPYSYTVGAERFQAQRINLKDVVQVSTAGGVILALDKYGTVWSWGRDGWGELGTGLVRGAIREPVRIIING
jgi:alpha-tubulin suppressor-like RCC1 family protein